MAGKAVQIIAGGIGVGAVAPFGVGQYTIVQQTTPPFITAGRLAQVADAVQSITANDVNAAADVTGFTIGSGSSTRGRPNTLAIGVSVLSSGDAGATQNVLLGRALDPGAAKANFAQNVIIGDTIDLTQTDGLNVKIGVGLTRSGAAFISASVLVGTFSDISGGDAVGIGSLVNVAAESVAVGLGVLGNGTQGVAIGKGATMGGNANAICIGRRARAGVDAIAIGFFCDSLGINGLSIGRDATNNGFDNTIVLGRAAGAGVANEAVIGGGASPFWSTQFRVGRVFADGGYPGLTWQLTSSNFAGVDQVAPPATIDCGTNTGAAAGGELRIRTGTIVASGAARQALAERFAVLPSTGAAGSPGVRFSNVANGAGAAAGTLLNAPTAGDPIFWLPVSIGGLVRYIPCWP